MEDVSATGSKQFSEFSSRCCVVQQTDFPIKQEFRDNSRTRTGGGSVCQDTPIPVLPVNTKRLTLRTIEHLHRKYFGKSAQDNMTVVANILNIMTVFDRNYTASMFESLKKTTDAGEKQRIRETLEGYRNLLKSELERYFTQVISKFHVSEFEPAFQIVLSSLLTALKVMDPTWSRKKTTTNLFILSRFIWSNLNDGGFERVKVLLMSTNFRSNCVSLINLIEFNREFNPDLPKRMPVFFASSRRTDQEQHFRTVINGMNSFQSYENLKVLMDTAVFKCRSESTFENYINAEVNSTPIVKENVNVNLNVKVNVIPAESVVSSTSKAAIQWKLVGFPSAILS